jgi:hypothetical protein
MPPIAKPLRLLVLLISGLVALTALVVGPASAALPLFVTGARPAWALFGFELVTLAAAILGVLLGQGRFRSGPAIGLACIAGTILVASGLGWQSTAHALGGVSLNPLLAFRVAAALVLGLVAAWSALSRHPSSLRTACLGVLLIAPVVGAGGLLATSRGREWAGAAIGSSPAVEFIVASVAFLAATALLAAGVHLVIRAFELGRPASIAEETTSRSA